MTYIESMKAWFKKRAENMANPPSPDYDTASSVRSILTEDTTIPPAIIPDLVEWLVTDSMRTAGLGGETAYYGVYYPAATGTDMGGEEAVADIKAHLTAALTAFNDREVVG